MQQPASNSRTINDLVQDVIEALQGRTDVASIVPKYVKRAIQEITVNMPFEALRRTGPLVTLTVSQSVYPVSTFLNAGDDYTSPEVFSIYVDFPNNTILQAMDYKTPKAIKQMIAPGTQGLPSRWTRYGPNFWVGPTPNNTYSVVLDYQVRYPFSDDVTQLAATPLLFDDDWEEIVVYSAAMRIAFVKRWNDQWQQLHQLIYGDPEFMQSDGKKGRPGILSARMLQVERDQKFNSRQVTILVPRYTSR